MANLSVMEYLSVCAHAAFGQTTLTKNACHIHVLFVATAAIDTTAYMHMYV